MFFSHYKQFSFAVVVGRLCRTSSLPSVYINVPFSVRRAAKGILFRIKCSKQYSIYSKNID